MEKNIQVGFKRILNDDLVKKGSLMKQRFGDESPPATSGPPHIAARIMLITDFQKKELIFQ